MPKPAKNAPASAMVRPPVIVPPDISAGFPGCGSIPRPPGAEPLRIAPPAPVRRCQKCQSTHTRFECATAEEETWLCLEPHCGRRFRVRIHWDFGASRRCAACGSVETKLRSVGAGLAWRDCSRCGRSWKVTGMRI